MKRNWGEKPPDPHSNGAHVARDATVSNAAAWTGIEMGEGKGGGGGVLERGLPPASRGDRRPCSRVHCM